MERINRTLNKTQFGFLATVDGNEPRVRPFQFQFEEDGKYYFCTSKNKKVAEQLLSNPFIEYAVYNKAFEYARISGTVSFCNDLKLKEKIFELNPYYKEKFGSIENENMILFYLEHGTANIGHFDNYPPEIIQF